MAKLYDHLRGRWSASQPAQAGVYLMREPTGGSPWVTYWDADAASPFGAAPTGGGRREFFYLEGDADQRPTRWDDPCVPEMARAGGWREAKQPKP